MLEKLKEAGMRVTPQRLAIIKFLDGNTSHPSVEEIYRKLKPEFPSLSMATVYNTLETLNEAGIIQEINIEPGKRHFDPNPKPHCHFYCRRCKRVFDVDLDIQPVDGPAWIGEFWVENCYTNLVGKCRDCINSSKKQ